MAAIHGPAFEPDLMLPTMSIVLEPEAAMSKLTAYELSALSPLDGADFVLPICTPVALSTRRRSVTVAASLADRLTTMVLILTPSVAPAVSVKLPSLALLVPAIIV